MDALATGEGAHYPMLSATISTVQQNYPDNVDDIGVFALPAAERRRHVDHDVAAERASTSRRPTEGDKLEAAKKFVAFANSPDGLRDPERDGVGRAVRTRRARARCPTTCPALVADIQAYFDAGKTGPGARVPLPDQGTEPREHHRRGRLRHPPAEEGAAQYDEDVKKQAQQLGLPGW